jgi:superfamily I DNA/RNA helicase
MPNHKGEMRAAQAQDRLSCLLAAAQGCDTISGLRHKLTKLFDEQNTEPCVVLGTIHKMKGLESDRVTILRPDLLPHPMARTDREIAQELNCLYVALTRSRNQLHFVDQLPFPLQHTNV